MLIPAALALTGAGCYSDPIPLPDSYKHHDLVEGAAAPSPATSATHATPSTINTSTRPSATANSALSLDPTPAPVIPMITEAARDAVLQQTHDTIIAKYSIAKEPQLSEYLVLVGSLITIKSDQPEADYEYLLLDTKEAITCAVAPRTICLSRGLLSEMEDESELAGVLAREIGNLTSNRALKAAGLPPMPIALPATRPTTRVATTTTAATTTVTTQPTSREAIVASSKSTAPPDPRVVSTYSQKLTSLLLKQSLPTEAEQAADREGAQLAAAAQYAPDGFLRLLTRRRESMGQWDRIRTLDAAVNIIAKAHPHADVKLPARFETFVKPKTPD